MPDQALKPAAVAREARHRHIREASRAALASAEFRQALDDLKARCEAAQVIVPAPRESDVAFDSDRERDEGWAFEAIGNAFA